MSARQGQYPRPLRHLRQWPWLMNDPHLCWRNVRARRETSGGRILAIRHPSPRDHLWIGCCLTIVHHRGRTGVDLDERFHAIRQLHVQVCPDTIAGRLEAHFAPDDLATGLLDLLGGPFHTGRALCLRTDRLTVWARWLWAIVDKDRSGDGANVEVVVAGDGKVPHPAGASPRVTAVDDGDATPAGGAQMGAVPEAGGLDPAVGERIPEQMAGRGMDDRDAVRGLDFQVVTVAVVVHQDSLDPLGGRLAGAGVGGEDLVTALEVGDGHGGAASQQDLGARGKALAAAGGRVPGGGGPGVIPGTLGSVTRERANIGDFQAIGDRVRAELGRVDKGEPHRTEAKKASDEPARRWPGADLGYRLLYPVTVATADAAAQVGVVGAGGGVGRVRMSRRRMRDGELEWRGRVKQRTVDVVGRAVVGGCHRIEVELVGRRAVAATAVVLGRGIAAVVADIAAAATAADMLLEVLEGS